MRPINISIGKFGIDTRQNGSYFQLILIVTSVLLVLLVAKIQKGDTELLEKDLGMGEVTLFPDKKEKFEKEMSAVAIFMKMHDVIAEFKFKVNDKTALVKASEIGAEIESFLALHEVPSTAYRFVFQTGVSSEIRTSFFHDE